VPNTSTSAFTLQSYPVRSRTFLCLCKIVEGRDANPARSIRVMSLITRIDRARSVCVVEGENRCGARCWIRISG